MIYIVSGSGAGIIWLDRACHDGHFAR